MRNTLSTAFCLICHALLQMGKDVANAAVIRIVLGLVYILTWFAVPFLAIFYYENTYMEVPPYWKGAPTAAAMVVLVALYNWFIFAMNRIRHHCVPTKTKPIQPVWGVAEQIADVVI